MSERSEIQEARQGNFAAAQAAFQRSHWFATDAAPVAPFTWELTSALAGTVEVTPVVPAEFRQPLVILGFYPEVLSISSGSGLLDPEVKDLEIELNTNETVNWTQQRGPSANMGPGGSFVSLNALNIANRLVFIELRNASPQVGVRFKWKYWLEAFSSQPRYNDALITLSMFCFYPKKDVLG